MRRPAQTKKQKQHAREQRALLRLRRAAVRYSFAGDAQASEQTRDDFAMVQAELAAACDSYREALTVREARRLSR